MNVLLIGSGGREHALAWKIASSPLLGRLWCAPGNPGMARHGACADLDPADHPAVIGFCRAHAIDLVVVGPEAPLVAGITDSLQAAGIKAFGPSAAAARLEGSKGFTKDLCARHGIPTATHARFDNAPQARAHVRRGGVPVVVKADGLAAGKGVIVAATVAEACAAIDDCFEGAFGEAGSEIVVEEYLDGEEASFFCLCAGVAALPLAAAQDYKRVHDGDSGPNTGGMGACSPAPAMTQALIDATMERIVRPTLHAMADAGSPFSGILYAGLMITADGPKLVEYNVRFGDPECQVLMVRLEDDLLPLMKAAVDGRLEHRAPRWSNEAALCVVLAARGYPGPTSRGSPIGGLDAAAALSGVEIFQAGTALAGGKLVANGGRVLAVCARGASIEAARTLAYEAVGRIDWEDGFCRRDIGSSAIGREARGKR